MTTGERIKQLRRKKGLSQEELGRLIGVQKAAINKYENGTIVNLKRSTIEKLAEVLDSDPIYILGIGKDADMFSIFSGGEIADKYKEILIELTTLDEKALQDVIKYIAFLKSQYNK